MSKVLMMWRADNTLWRPVHVVCPHGLYPSRDAEGHSIYENTHFFEKSEAWNKLLSESEAWVKLTGKDVLNAEKTLRKTKDIAAQAAKAFSLVRDGIEEGEENDA